MYMYLFFSFFLSLNYFIYVPTIRYLNAVSLIVIATFLNVATVHLQTRVSITPILAHIFCLFWVYRGLICL